MITIENPILRGFQPDPSIISVGEDYYIATSTFEWFPGVQIHHSRDLKHWRLIARPLNRLSQLDMAGNPDSCGVWAPCLTYDKGTFYLVYSNVRSFDGVWKDVHNYLVTTTDIRGEWSEPIYLNSSGFDPSLFHAPDGRKWVLNMLADHRDNCLFGGIVLQEFDPEKWRMSGPVFNVFASEDIKNVEGPHLYYRNGFYYLLMAAGGTEYDHCVILARSKDITGPYEAHPSNPVLTTQGDPDWAIQKAGHGDLVCSPDGDWYIAFLCGRPLSTLGRCTLGRETSLTPVEWREDGWLYLKNGTQKPDVSFSAPGSGYPVPVEPERYEFEETVIPIAFQSLRAPATADWANLEQRPGFLRLYGRESLSSFHHQSLLARRLSHFEAAAATALEFQPKTFQQMAGLIAYYNTGHFYYLHITWDEHRQKRVLDLIACDHYSMSQPMGQCLDLQTDGRVELKLHFNHAKLQFFYREGTGDWQKAGPVLDGSILSDDYVMEQCGRYRPAFTGAMIGICCQDLTGSRKPADFDWFEYKPVSKR